MTRALLWVQHLLGSGHVERMRWVAEALAARGPAVTFVTGGLPLPGRMPRGPTIVQLPPLAAADARFSGLVDEHGSPPDEAFKARRTQALLAAYQAARPDVVVLETYPFGRRPLRFELEPLLERIGATRPRPAVAVSVRDLLQRRDDPSRDVEAWATAQRHVDLILVHGDAAFARLEETLPPAAGSAIPVEYTGFVRGPQPRVEPGPRDEVVIAVGGGGVGRDLVAAAIAARAMTTVADMPWHARVGPGMDERAFAALVAAGEQARVRVERHGEDFAARLARARVAVTQAGYNTVLDVLALRAPSVLVPFEGAGETEQRMRADRLAALGRAEVVREQALSARTLAAAIDRAAAKPLPPPCPFALDGAQRAAEALLALVRTRTTP